MTTRRIPNTTATSKRTPKTEQTTIMIIVVVDNPPLSLFVFVFDDGLMTSALSFPQKRFPFVYDSVTYMLTR